MVAAQHAGVAAVADGLVAGPVQIFLKVWTDHGHELMPGLVRALVGLVAKPGPACKCISPYIMCCTLWDIFGAPRQDPTSGWGTPSTQQGQEILHACVCVFW